MLITNDISYDYIITILVVVISWNEIFDFKEEGRHFVSLRWLYHEYNLKFLWEMNTEDGVFVKGGSM